MNRVLRPFGGAVGIVFPHGATTAADRRLRAAPRPLVVGTRDSVNLLVGPTAKSVKLTATYDGPEGRRQACRVVQPLGATSAFACP